MDDFVGDNQVTDALGKKPRRLDENNVTYLVQLETQLAVSGTVTADESEDAAELRETLVDNVLAEIMQCTASVACDRRTNVVLEKLCYISNLQQLLTLMQRFTPYSVFLARQRHASHVYQALLARLCFLLKHHGIPTTQPETLNEDILQETVLSLVRPVLKEISWLAKELSASHVIRNIFCCLAGMPVISERKGKGSKHQHSVSLSETLENLIEPKQFYISRTVLFYVPQEFHEALKEAAERLLNLSSAELQDLVADTSSCTVLSLASRILSTPDLVQGGDALIERLVRSALQWPESEDGACAQGALVFYGMAGDKSASHFLETVLECCSNTNGFIAMLMNGTLVSRAKEYADDAMGNFVLQAGLRRLTAELERMSADGSSSSSKKPKKSDVLVTISSSLLAELSLPAVFRDLAIRRGGVCLWLLELGRSIPPGESSDTGWAETIGNAMIEHWRSFDQSVELHAFLSAKLAVLSREAGEGKAAAAPAPRTGGKAVYDKTSQDSAQLLLARQLGAILRLPPVTSACRAACSAVSKLQSHVLKHIATHGPMSKAVLDTFFESAAAASSKSEDLLFVLLTTLQPHVVELAYHFIGQHVIRQAFERSGFAGKELLVRAIDAGKEKLAASKEGRNSLKVVHADLFARQPQDWVALVNRHNRAKDILMDLDDSNRGKERNPASKREGRDEGVADAHGVLEGGGRKRKRKRPSSKKSGGNEIAED